MSCFHSPLGILYRRLLEAGGRKESKVKLSTVATGMGVYIAQRRSRLTLFARRIGQKKPVHVYQLIAENTVESKVLDIQEKKKQLIKEVSIAAIIILPFWFTQS